MCALPKAQRQAAPARRAAERLNPWLRISRAFPAVLLTLTACQPAQLDTPEPPAQTIEQTEILWDTWGVPHIFATSTTELFYAHGWAQAEAHGDLLLRLLGKARGRAAEYWGEEHLAGDRYLHTMGVPERAEEWYQAQKEPFRAGLDAFARGINEYATQHADQIDDDVEVVLPVTGQDLLAHLQRVLHFTFIVSRYDIAGLERRWSAGSNAWAIAPERSASGHALLLANPHLPWADLFTWFEVHLVTEEVNISGAILVGNPFVSIGFNDHLGWTHTVNTHDGYDLYELAVDGASYRFDGELHPFKVEEKVLKVRRGDVLEEETLRVRHALQGPVVAEDGDRALALKVVGLNRPHLFEQYWDMARATNLEEFEGALRRLQMPMFTTMYADRDGHILHLFGGLTPVRPAGDWSWSGVVPGDTADTLWTTSHTYEDLPRVVDPVSGWLQNANDPPWTTTFPTALDADDFPTYMAPRFMHFRAQQSALLLRDDEEITFDELVTYKHSTQVRAAERLLDDLEAAVSSHGDEAARRAFEVLHTWDRHTNADSRGAVLFLAFFGRLEDQDFATPWREDAPLTTPDGLADPAAAAAALSAAAAEVERLHGSLDVAWGDLHRLRRGEVDLPGNGGPSQLGVFRVASYGPDDDGKHLAAQGDSYIAVVEFSDPVRAEVLLSYGNASQPGSPHVGDQLELFAKQELRPAWRTREEIEAHLERRERF